MTIEYPTKNSLKYFDDKTIYVRADDTTVNKYISDVYSGHTLVSYEPEVQRFSNDGALAYQYYGPFTGYLPGDTGITTTDQWQTEFGFSQIVKELIIS